MLNESFFNRNAFAVIEGGIAYSPSEEPVQNRDVGRFEDVEVTADYCWSRRISLDHGGFELLEPPCGMREDEMQIKYSYGLAVHRYVSVQVFAVFGFCELRHQIHKKA